MDRPRLTVFKSAKHIYAQIIDDNNGKTLVSASTMTYYLASLPVLLVIEGNGAVCCTMQVCDGVGEQL